MPRFDLTCTKVFFLYLASLMKIGVTGASGHIGTNLIRALDRAGYPVRVLQHKTDTGFHGFDLERCMGDLHRQDTLIPFCNGLDVVFHLAAVISIGDHLFETLYDTNVHGTKNLVNACRTNGVKKLIHFSSIHALNHYPLDVPMDETRDLALHAALAYERTKALAEEWVLSRQSKDFDVIVLNPTAVLGPNDFAPSLSGQFIIRLLKHQLPGLLKGGYNWVDVRDILRSHILDA